MYTASTLRRTYSGFRALFLGACLGFSALTAQATPSTTVVVSQIYGGGGNSGSVYKNDFIELHNISSTAVSVAGWSVQYASATGTSWAATNLTGSIPAGGYYLVQEAAGTGGTTSLPTPNATGSIALSGTAGKVALVNSTTALSGQFANGSGTGIVDFVGFGTTANGFEGTGPTPAPSNTTSVARTDSGSTDTDNNASDFTSGTVGPRNSATPPYLPAATKLQVETTSGVGGSVVPSQTLQVGSTLTAYSISRTATNAFVANAPVSWSLTSITGGIVVGDLVPSSDGKSATFTPHAAGSAVIHVASGALTPGDSGTITANASTQVRVETTASAIGISVPATTVAVGNSTTVYANSRAADGAFVANAPASWTLISATGGIVAGDLVSSGDGKSATFTPHAAGTAVIHATINGLASVDSGTFTASAPTQVRVETKASATGTLIPAQPIGIGRSFTVYANTRLADGSFAANVAATWSLTSLSGGVVASDLVPASDGKSAVFTPHAAGSAVIHAVVSGLASVDSGTLTAQVAGPITIFHTNDTHARVTPHYWIVPQHSTNPVTQFEAVGGAAYVGAKILSLTAAQPDALVLDGGDISEGNPIGDWNGPPAPAGSFGNATIVNYFKLVDTKLKAIPGRSGRGLDAMVVGNHDIRNITYLNNMKAASLANFPILSINICIKGTHTPYYQPYAIVNVNGNKVGIIGYTTESADSGDPEVTAAIDVVKCDWSSTDSTKIHFADYVNELRNTQGCSMVILLTHMGHSGLCTVTGANPTPILVDNAVARVPEIVVSGHWHTYSETVWQPTSLNYKTIFTEAGSFTHYVSELRVDETGKYLSNANYPIRSSQITPDADIAALIQTQKDAYAVSVPTPTYGVDQVIGYTAEHLLLDNYMKWWSSDEYPWSGDNTAGAWICDAMRWKANALFPATPCDLAIEAGGGVRSDIPAGAITYSQIYETFPWADDTIYLIKMTGQQIFTYFKDHGCDAAMSRGWFVTAHDGVPTSITFNNAPIDLGHQYNVAINNYMYTHDASNLDVIDPAPQTSTYLARTALFDYTATFPENARYSTGGPRYSMDTEFSGGYRGVITMMSDSNSRTTFDCGFIRLLSANPETLAHRGTQQVPTTLVNADGSVMASNRLAENQLYRSYLGFRTGILHPGDIIETWGKGAFFEGNPEFVDQEGIQSDGVEFKIVGHDDSLAKPVAVPNIATALDDAHKNHYVKVLARKTGTNTVVDQNNSALTVWNVDAFVVKTLPGNVDDLLVLTGVATSEKFAMRFRCDNAVLASTVGITSFPPASTVTSHVDQIPASTTTAQLNLTATAAANSGTVYSLSPVADATVSSGNANTNNNSTTLFMQSGSGSFGNERDWLKFDLSVIPAGLTITSAQLQLFCWTAASTSLPVAVSGGDTDSWIETGITWNTQPTFGSALDAQTLASSATNITYSWDVTSFALAKLASNKLVSLLAKPVTENAATDITYKFDSKEFGSNGPVLKVTTAPSGPLVTVAQVQFFYRFSGDNTTWGAWTAIGTDTAAPYSASFGFPQGFGYYEFYSVATGSNGVAEAAPLAAQTATHYTAVPPYPTTAIVTLGNLTQTYNGTPRSVSATTLPPGLALTLTYNGSATAPVNVGLYNIVATINQLGYTGGTTGLLSVQKAGQTIAFGAIGQKTVSDPAFSLTGSSTSGLAVTYTSSNPAVATVSGSTVTLVGPGTTTITAAQAGNANYDPATPVDQPLTVTSGTVPGGNSDVPAMPLWAIGALAVALFAVATRLLKPQRQQ